MRPAPVRAGARVLGWALLLAGAALARDAGDLDLRLPEGPVLLGDWFELSVSGDLPPGARLQLGELPDGLATGPQRREDGPAGTTLVLPLRSVREGALTLEHLALVGGEVLEPLPAVTVQVYLPLATGRLPRVAELLPPVALPSPRPPLALVSWLLAAGLAAFTWAVARAGQSRPLPPVPVRPPELVVAEALAALRARLPGNRDEVPGFVVAVSHQLRWFIEAFHGLAAPERTSEEFLAEAASASGPLGEQRGALTGFLGRCDLVKFAALRPDPTEALGLLEVAEAFVVRSCSPPAEPGT